MHPRTLIAGLVTLAAASAFVRLGIWQLERLGERRARNVMLASRFGESPIDATQLSDDSATAHYRRVTLSGTYDYDHEVVLSARSLNGSPGVNLATPLHPDGGGRAILVNRGWVFSGDAYTVDQKRWREPVHTRVSGYVEEFRPADRPVAAGAPARRVLDGAALAKELPYPIAPFYVVAVADSAHPAVQVAASGKQAAAAVGGVGATPVGESPVRLSLPVLDEGPHASYAIQWFFFAAIALFGLVFLVRQERRRPGG